MDRNILVYVDLLGTPHLVGRLWVRTRRGKEGATFRYADGWLANPNHFSLEPALTLGPGPLRRAAQTRCGLSCYCGCWHIGNYSPPSPSH